MAKSISLYYTLRLVLLLLLQTRYYYNYPLDADEREAEEEQRATFLRESSKRTIAKQEKEKNVLTIYHLLKMRFFNAIGMQKLS